MVLVTGIFVSTIFSVLVFLFLGSWYWNGLFAWCVDQVKVGGTCYPIAPPGGYFASWEFSTSLAITLASVGLTFLVWRLLKRMESSSASQRLNQMRALNSNN